VSMSLDWVRTLHSLLLLLMLLGDLVPELPIRHRLREGSELIQASGGHSPWSSDCALSHDDFVIDVHIINILI
jgi:hypothetical protein